MTHEEMLDKYIGSIGTQERDEFETKVMAGVEELPSGEIISSQFL